MNVAHVIGEHHFVDQWQSLWHTLGNWLPIAIGVIFMTLAAWSIMRRRYQLELVRIRNK